MKAPTAPILDRILDPLGQLLTPEVAKRFADFRFDRRTRTHISSLARKCNEGELTDAERAEYEACVHTIEVISILQAKARAVLKQAPSRK
jgi:hypothetical protein